MPLIGALLVALMLAGVGQDRFGNAQYEAIVEAYQRGDTETAAAALARWPAADLRRAVDAVTRPPGLWRDAHLRSATLLHRDVVFAGRASTPGEMVLHLDLASRLTLALDIRDRSAAGFQIDWHVLAAHLLLSESLADDAERLVRRALDRNPSHPRLELLAGIIEEHRAHRLDPSLSEPPTVAAVALTPARRRLLLATDHYRKVVAGDPGAMEAAMRLGYVLFLTNQWTEARSLLERASSGPALPRVRYLSALFLGALHLRQNDAQAARRVFALAVKLSPDSQTPYIALSLAEQALGRAAAAHSVIAAWAKRPPPATLDDPWWDYYYGVAEIGPLAAAKSSGGRATP